MPAVGTERISKIVGYQFTAGDFSNTTPNLPQRIAVVAEANEANQATLNLTPREITTAKEAGDLYGYGSPIYQIMRILRPLNGGGVGGVPTIVYPVAKAAGAVAKILEITPTGTATGSGTHSVVLSGRYGIDGVNFSYTVASGDTPAVIVGKIVTALNNALSSPIIAVDATTKVTATAKWTGLTSNDLNISIDTNGNGLGITYSVTAPTAGAGTPSIQPALDYFGNDWVTIVVNGFNTVTTVMDALEVFNGRPDLDNPTGRYRSTLTKPFIAVTGSVLENPTTITDGRLGELTIAIAPAPLSKGMPYEAAANAAVLLARQAQDNPHLDISGMTYPDMPTPLAIGAMANYDNRDSYVKKGSSTVDLIGGKYTVQDFVTTYHPAGEIPPQYRYVRNIMIDFNVRFGYYLLEQINVVDHAIAANNDIVNATKVIKPKQWKQILDRYADDLAKRAIIVDPKFMQDNTTVNLSTTNPDRLESFFKYKRSGFVRIASTTAQAGFNFGNV